MGDPQLPGRHRAAYRIAGIEEEVCYDDWGVCTSSEQIFCSVLLRCEQARSRGASPPAPGADLPGTPDPRGAIAIWVL